MGDDAIVSEVTEGLGERWELLQNTFKPYPCGIVMHAVIDACLAHVVRNKTEAAYFRTDLFEPRRKLMATWSAFATGAHGHVVPMSRPAAKHA